MTSAICLIWMYETYARILHHSGDTSLPLNLFTGIFRQKKSKRAGSDPHRGEGDISSNQTITRAVKQTSDFSAIYGMEEEKKRIKTAALDILAARKSGAAVRNGILLTGEPGNGKTQLAKALAGEIKLPLVELTYQLVASKWINETTINLGRALSEAKRAAPCVLLIDEIDSFLVDRSLNCGNYPEDRKIVNLLLTELVNLRNCGVVIVAATNHLNKLDSAGVREGRFDFKIDVQPPTTDARRLILCNALKKSMPKVAIEPGAIETVAKRWNGFSVVRILSVAKEMASIHRDRPYKLITATDIYNALRVLQGSQGLPVHHAKGIDNMFLPAILKDDLKSIVYRMQHIQEIEDAGGSLPTGLIFYGAEPGTGKTECARSLAKDSGWALLATTSNDLIADAGEIDKLFKEALNIRPCIIFIDEANDVLRDRSSSPYSAITNQLLSVMDGVASERRDVMFVAATNYIEHIDAAVLRGGRISEKFRFDVPARDDQITFMTAAIANSKSKFAPELTPTVIVSLLKTAAVKGTVANMVAVVQDAVNARLARSGDPLVGIEDVRKAIGRQTLP